MATFRCASCGALNRVPDGGGPAGRGLPVCGRCKRDLDTSGAPQPVSGEAFSSAVGASPVPVLVDFWAPWCAPCRAAAPVFESVGRARAGRLLVLKVNTDDETALAQQLGIRAIPTFALFEHGREVARETGLMGREQIESWIAGAGSSPPAPDLR